MRKLLPLLLLIMVTFSLGFARKPVVPVEGVYPVKSRAFTFFDLFSGELSDMTVNLAELTESQPEGVRVDPELKKLNQLRYGSVKLGNTNEKTWFVVGSEKGAWPVVYIDQNNDRLIEAKEKIKGIQTNQVRRKGMQVEAGANLIPFPVQVVFKGTSTLFEKRLYFFAQFERYSRDGNTEELVRLISASFLDGEIKVYDGKKFQQVKFRIVDGNSNGCFNDYGKDLIFFDSNFDGFFKKKEGQPLVEYFDYIGPDKQKRQLRMIVLPHPAKIAVVDSTLEIDRSQLESGTDQPESEKASQ